MNHLHGIIFICMVFILCVLSKPQEKKVDAHKSIEKDLSDEKHEADGGHNVNYDHEAFLGKEESKEFDQLSPEESQKKLAKLVDKMDVDKDGFITQKELHDSIKSTSQRYLRENRDRHWKDMGINDTSSVEWNLYKSKTFGNDTSNSQDEAGTKSMNDMIKRDEVRWAAADVNKDGKLDRDEFLSFLHPEEFPHMHHVVVEETMNDMDKDKDGKISLAEYINDLWSNESGEEEPSWVATEREQFSGQRDLNKDGFLDINEVKSWIVPTDYDHVESEVKHLINTADDDNDKKLSKEEILKHYDTFVGSQVTDFGEALNRKDEL